jgi:adenosylhomocysteine nucleosidase
MTVVVAAMPEEVAGLRARLTNVRRVTGCAPDAVVGGLGGRDVVVAVTGDGERNAREGIAAVLAAVRAERLITLGIAGGLSRDLREGDLVIADRVMVEGARERGPTSSEIVFADGPSVEAALRATAARRAIVVTANRIADSVSEKHRLLTLAAAGTTSAVVDLESASYVRAAVRAAIPWIVLRAVSDTADEALPALLNRARDAGGAVRRGSVVRGLLGDPAALPVLMALRRRLRQCGERLGRAAEALLNAPAPLAGLDGRTDAEHATGAQR